MLTGVETAGLVLAAFPLIISALEDYQEGFETLQDWWRFRSEFVAFTHSIGIQSVLFTENLEELLKPVVISDLQMSSLLDDPGGPAWNDPDIEQRLMERLPKSYNLYRCAIDDINRVMEKLKTKLGIKNNQMTWKFDKTAQGRSKWSYEFQRIKFTLSKKKRERLLQSLANRNDELQKLLGSSDRLAPARHRRKKSLSKFSQRVQDHACCLYAVLTSGWGCSCRPTHNVNLLLENRFSIPPKIHSVAKNAPEIHFNILFHFGNGSTRTPPAPWTWQETEIKVLENIVHQLTAPPDSQLPKSRSPVRRSTSAGNSQDSFKSLPQKFKSVNFTQDEQITPSIGPEEIETITIDSLCEAIKETRQGQTRLGLLIDQQKRRYGFRPVTKPQPILDTHERITLENLLKCDRSNRGSSTSDQGIALSRRERLLVAVILASSLLQLHSTPWLNQNWSKRNIFFLKASENSPEPITIEQLYISPYLESSSTTTTEGLHNTRSITVMAANECRKSILALGIMLLELCFGQALEDQHFRKNYLGPDGQPNDFTDFATALQWQEDALGEGGPGFDNAIRRCIICNFGTKTMDLADDEFREAVYNEVVQPLEETLRCFDNVTW